MSSKTFIVGFTEINTAAGVGYIASNISSAVESGNDTYSIVNDLGQVVATVTSLVPVLRPVSIQANTLAASTTFLK